VLPDINKSFADNITKEIILQLNNMFKEIHDNINVNLKSRIVSYPEDVNDYLDLFYNIIKV
jgi:hypothetical protein